MSKFNHNNADQADKQQQQQQQQHSQDPAHMANKSLQSTLTTSTTKPTVMITTYSECSSRFKLCSWNRSHHNKHLSNSDNYSNSIDNCGEESQQSDDNSATKSENSTDFFNQLKRSHYQKQQFNYNHNRALGRGKVLIDLSQIKGPTGSIRGHKDVVRKSLEGIQVATSRRNGLLSTFMSSPNNSNLLSLTSAASLLFNSSLNSSKLSSLQQIDEQLCSEYLERLVEDEQNHCVAYTTTLGVIRRTFDDSKLMKSILNLNLIKYEERDIYLNQEYKYQLKMRCNSIIVPALFVDGQHIGGSKELELMNENGELQKVLSKFKMSTAARDVCLCCGNAKFIACPSCNGSRKSTIHHFKYNSVALRCIKCDKNDGLVQCPVCCCKSPPLVGGENVNYHHDEQSTISIHHNKTILVTKSAITNNVPATQSANRTNLANQLDGPSEGRRQVDENNNTDNDNDNNDNDKPTYLCLIDSDHQATNHKRRNETTTTTTTTAATMKSQQQQQHQEVSTC